MKKTAVLIIVGLILLLSAQTWAEDQPGKTAMDPNDEYHFGDINDNGIPFEIGDAMMYSNYFIYGLAAFEPHVELSIYLSDVNNDGVTLTTADLLLLFQFQDGKSL